MLLFMLSQPNTRDKIMEDPLLSLLSSQLMDRYTTLTTLLLKLSDQLKISQYQLWLPMPFDEPKENKIMLDRLIRGYLDIWYEGNQDGRETRSYPGLVGVSAATFAIATRVNEAKAAFQASVQALQLQDKRAWRSIQETLPTFNREIRHLLSLSGVGRLHLKQANRQIPLLQSTPAKIGFSWYSSGKSIKRISVKDAENLLLQLSTDSPHIQIQLDKLASLPKDEHLARVQTLAPIMRANVVYGGKDDRQSGFTDNDSKKNTPKDISRKAMNVSLPIMFPLKKDEVMPVHNEISLTPPEQRTRLRRSDIKTEDEVFLPSIRVYRYR